MTIHTMSYEDGAGSKATISFDGRVASIQAVAGKMLRVPSITPCNKEKWSRGVLKAMQSGILLGYETLTI